MRRRGNIRLTLAPARNGQWHVNVETRRHAFHQWDNILGVFGTNQEERARRLNAAIQALAELEALS